MNPSSQLSFLVPSSVDETPPVEVQREALRAEVEHEGTYARAVRQNRQGMEERDKVYGSSESTRSHQSSTTYMPSQKYGAASESAYGVRRDAKPPPASSGQAKYKRIDPPQQSNLSYDFLRGDQRLQEIEYQILSVKADIADLQTCYEEKSTALVTTRHELKSVQAQLDSVQHFISTADAHADQDIIQKLQGLNEEVYQLSMTMADRLVESFVRQSATARQKKELNSTEKFVLATIGKALVNHLSVVDGDEDVALFLQIAFQGCLSYLICQVVSMWTVEHRLNAFVNGTYSRLRKAESQSIYGHWRSLTRTYIQPTPATEPEPLAQSAISALSNIVLATGLSPPEGNTISKLTSEFGEGIESIISHAGKFGDMISGMISGNFEVFGVPPGTTFKKETMVDMNGDGSAPRGTEPPPTVLCVSRVGLRKQVAEKRITLTEAHVVLESFLG